MFFSSFESQLLKERVFEGLVSDSLLLLFFRH